MAGLVQAKDVILEEAGTLSTFISADEKESVEELTVSGPVNGADLLFLREMAGTDIGGNYAGFETMPDYTIYYTPLGGSLKTLDLSYAQIVEGSDEYYSNQTPENDVVEIICLRCVSIFNLLHSLRLSRRLAILLLLRVSS